MCPGDNVTFICTVTVSDQHFPLLTWINPKNEPDDRFTYSLHDMDVTTCVGGFVTKFIEGNNSIIVSTATLSNATEEDDKNKEIACAYDKDKESRNISLSGMHFS